MRITKTFFMTFIAVLMCIVATLPINAQTKGIPSKIYFTGTVNYDYGYDKARVVKCILDLNLKNGTVSGYTNYDRDGCEVKGTYKAKKDGTYYLDVYLYDNSGCDFEGTYNPKTGIFSGKFTGRGMSRSYPFRFVKSK